MDTRLVTKSAPTLGAAPVEALARKTLQDGKIRPTWMVRLITSMAARHVHRATHPFVFLADGLGGDNMRGNGHRHPQGSTNPGGRPNPPGRDQAGCGLTTADHQRPQRAGVDRLAAHAPGRPAVRARLARARAEFAKLVQGSRIPGSGRPTPRTCIAGTAP